MDQRIGRGYRRANSYEFATGLTWGFNFADVGILNHYFGISAKYVYSALAPGYGPGSEGIGQTFAIDVGYIWNFLPSMKVRLKSAKYGAVHFLHFPAGNRNRFRLPSTPL